MNLIWQGSFLDFLILTVILGGGAAWMAGRATARSWGAFPSLVVYIVLLTIAVRFVQYALFGGTFFLPPRTIGTALHYALVDFIVLMVIAWLGRRFTRAGQMAEQYSFAYDKAGAIGWRERA